MLKPSYVEALVLEAMCQAQFTFWRIERRHEIAGVMVADLLRDRRTRLLNEGLTHSANTGKTVVSTLCRPAEFAMTCGVIVPVELIEDAFSDSTAWLTRANSRRLVDDPQFAAGINHNGTQTGIVESIVYQEPAAAD